MQHVYTGSLHCLDLSKMSLSVIKNHASLYLICTQRLSKKITHCSSLKITTFVSSPIPLAYYCITGKDKWYGHNFQFWSKMGL